MLKSVSAEEAKRLLDSGRALLVDIRESDEFARERIPGAHSLPLSRLEEAAIPCSPQKLVVFQCRSGARTAANAARLAGVAPDGVILQGGLEAWKRAGLPVQADRDAPLELQRQVQIAAGAMVLSGVLLGLLVSAWFFALSAFVGAGLMFAGLSGFCGLARVLQAMPWNKCLRVAA